MKWDIFQDIGQGIFDVGDFLVGSLRFLAE